ncbi:hypothetical protein LTR91_013040 [Friedmanniomyces endolithicus]|uniref:Uncharacterized protein n=1 Tax=Friedmanniomyces endolithicus TaxID=329885 RepID=A0AAN6KEL1_9PEZI|nr:hypothetical protein LTR59_013843 [Friedmanniomyces endolithicus]KAK0785317.1 hypothetical protein LTR38_012399 [Friedmanniomyces endolithicus]KAK0803711.1 hypothetical protein LTR75_007868 [Friedmanniomyces endolithicus]KAK0846992.1 hypothetical protein LTS02_014644 [Friedmanniomyces endolithicus]KAK0870348.1 hypothetical protein LTR87_013364 [Friedmanniomyces endolithicus]
MHRALRGVQNELFPRAAEKEPIPGAHASVEARDPIRLDDTPADDVSSDDEDPLLSPPSPSPDPAYDPPTHPTNTPVIPTPPQPHGLKRRHSSPSLNPADHLPCPDLRRAYKRLRTEHATCETIEHNHRIRLRALESELANALAERDEAREECLAARRRARLGEEESRDVRLEMERHEGVVCLAVGVVSMVCSGWVGIQIGRELM